MIHSNDILLIMEPAIEIQNLRKTYAKNKVAVRNFSLTINSGEIFGFLGPNGAGKTTTIKIMLGLLKATSGSVRIHGKDPAKPCNRSGLGYLPEVANYYEFMNVRELLRYYGILCGMSLREIRRRTDEMLALVDLSDTATRPLKEFSKGMLQRAGIAQALLHDPDLLILDEPTTGLDPLGRMQMRDILETLRKAGKTVFFSSHELSEAEMICDHVGIIKNGSLSWCGPTREVAGEGEKNLEKIFLDIINKPTPTE